MLRRLAIVIGCMVTLFDIGRSTATLAAHGSGSHSDDIAIALTKDKLAIASVRIGATGDHRFLIDTGSSSTIVSDRLAAALGLVPYATSMTATVTGSYRTPVVTLPAL